MSTWRELYDDYKAAILNYTENLVITEYDFMRKISMAQQQFQRDTKLVDFVTTINRALDQTGNPLNYFNLPQDLLEVIEVQDSKNKTLLMQEYTQYRRNQATWNNQHTNTPTHYDYRLDPVSTINDPMIVQPIHFPWREDYSCHNKSRLFTIVDYQQKLYVQPDDTSETKLTLAYYPDLEAFSEQSLQWANWFPEPNFMPNFDTTGMNVLIRKWENAVLNYAIAKTIQQTGSANYQVYEKAYYIEVNKCIANKPNYFREGSRDYNFAPRP